MLFRSAITIPRILHKLVSRGIVLESCREHLVVAFHVVSEVQSEAGIEKKRQFAHTYSSSFG